MRITEHSATALVIQDRPWLESLVGALFIAGGLFAAVSGERVLGGGFMLAGAVLVLLLANTVTIRFDRGQGRFTRSTTGLMRSRAVAHALDDITGVRVQAGTSANPSRSYRLVLVLRSGAPLPLIPGYSTGQADKERMAAHIRRFLDLPAAPNTEAPGFGDFIKLMRG